MRIMTAAKAIRTALMAERVQIRDGTLQLQLSLDEIMGRIPLDARDGVSRDDIRKHVATLSIRTGVSYQIRL